jgi:PAS domain S-box-containing protein
MNELTKDTTQTVFRGHYVWILVIIWTLLSGLSLTWDYYHIKRDTLESARSEARGAYNKDLIYRRWAAGHGGVYVPVTEDTPPNPYLNYIAERDITTASGKRLTLINPAYMTRQVHELTQQQYGLRGHITSLKPIRPENEPDPWERKALLAFEDGETEVSTVEAIDDENSIRLMKPLVVEEQCLKCHAHQGYKVGDIRGGISVSVSLAPYQAMARGNIIASALGHGSIWILGLFGMIIANRRIMGYEKKRKQAEEALRQEKEMLAKAQQITHIGSWIWDIDTDKVLWSDELYKIHGLDREKDEDSLTAKLIQQMTHPDDIDRVLQNAENALKEFKVKPIEYRIIKPDGTVRTVYGESEFKMDLGHDKPVRMSGIVQDITERKRAEEALRQYEKIVSSSTDMLAFLDKQFNYLAANNAYIEAFKLTPEQLIGHTVAEVFGEEFSKTVIKPMADRCLSGEEINYQAWFDFPAHGRRYMDITYYPYTSEDNKIMGFVVNGRNITERKVAEEELEKHRKHLEELVKERTAELEKKIAELERLNKLFVEREFRIKELRDRMKERKGK